MMNGLVAELKNNDFCFLILGIFVFRTLSIYVLRL